MPAATASWLGAAIRRTTAGEGAISLYSELVNLDEEATPTIPISPQQKAAMEAYLGEVANMLEQMGFKPPHIEPVVRNAQGRPAFRVYYFDFTHPDTSAALRSSVCGNARPTFWLNGMTFLDSGEISLKDFQDLGHEVFHGVQARYPLFIEHCNDGPGAWIGEGTAQALGADLAAWSTRRLNYPHRSANQWPHHRWGLRPYDSPLFVKPSSDPAYAASSFWRYLGEDLTLAGGAGTLAVKPNYSYLIDFFSSSLETPINEVTSMYWLDQNLRNEGGKFKRGLDRVYPNFITAFAAYGGTRFSPNVRPAAENRGRWLGGVYPRNKCPVITLALDAATQRRNLSIATVASECFRIDSRFQSSDLQVRATSVDKDRLKALALGTDDGAVVVQPLLVQIGNEWNATWYVNLKASIEPIEVIISNVSDEPAYTRPFDGAIEFSIPNTENNLAPQGQGPTPPQPGTSPSQSSRIGNPGVNTKTAQDERVGQSISQGLDELNPNMVHGGGIVRSPDRTPCEDAFIDQTCGPVTTISLEFVPGIFGSLEQSTGRGGVFGQFASVMSGIADAGIDDVSRKAQEAAKRADSSEGTHVNITFPLIDYGFTGSFSNAYLTVNARNSETYKSIGPQDIQPGPGSRYPFAGKVTIEEYTPWLVRGSYSGHLVNVDKLDVLGEDATLPVHQNIQGRFNIVAPWRNDNRVVVETSEPAVQSVLDDMRMASAGLGMGVDEAIADAQQQASSSPASSGGTGYGVSTGCDCSCNTRAPLSQECRTYCEPTRRSCSGDKATPEMIVYVPPSIAASEISTEPFLRNVPEACTVLDEGSARSLLVTDVVKPSGPREWLPKVTSQCGHRANSKPSARTNLTIIFQPLAIIDSNTMSRDELRIKAGGFSMLMGKEQFDVEGVGNIAFASIDDDTVTLKIFTGIYGTSMDSDELITELVLTYTLTDSEQSDADRMKNLYDMTRIHVQALQEKSRTTHEGT